jgi:hypothetical protein
MAIERGTYGLVQVATSTTTPVYVTVASQQSWTWDETNESVDSTSMGATRLRSNVVTFVGVGATSSGFWDTDDLTATEGQGIVRDASLSGDSIMLRIYPSATLGVATAGDEYYEAEVTVTGCNVTGSYDNLVRHELQFSLVGQLDHGVHV